MISFTIIVFAISLCGCVIVEVNGSYCTGQPDPRGDKPNMYPIMAPSISHVADWRAPNNMSQGGRLFTAKNELGNTTFPILHLYGDPYTMGYAHGVLLKTQSIAMWNEFWDYLVKQAGSEANVEAIIIPIQEKSAPFISHDTMQELQGLADATQFNYTRILWMHLYPETSGGHCSMFGAWGSATQKSYNGNLLQMRALDYITRDFLSDNHALLVYHPNEGMEFINVGFSGLITMVTGLSSAPMALSQIGVSNPDNTFGPQRNGDGVPFIFLLRNLIQYENNLSSVKAALERTRRTLDLILGFGVPYTNNGTEKPFTGVQYAADQLRFYDDSNMLPVNRSWHPRIKDVVYHGMDWLCPGWTKPLGEALKKYFGNITAQITVREINSRVQTGNLHIAIYEFDGAFPTLYLSHSAGSNQVATGGPKYAYERPFLHINTTSLFSTRLSE